MIVTHHPPMTAFHLRNDRNGVHVTGSCGQKTKFTGTAVKVEQRGGVRVELVNRPAEESSPSATHLSEDFASGTRRTNNVCETYDLTLPELHIRGLMTASLFLELTGTVDVTSSTGYTAHIDFIPKPWFSGEYHGIKGCVVTPQGDTSHVFAGKWNEVTTVARADAHGKAIEDTVTTLWKATDADGTVTEPDPLTVPNLEVQGALASRVVWRATTEALCAADWTGASQAKQAVEEKQRALRRKRAENGQTWVPALFESNDPLDFEMGR